MIDGAGVDPDSVYRPGKRLKAWHRRDLASGETQLSLRAYARSLPLNPIARGFLAVKGDRQAIAHFRSKGSTLPGGRFG